VAGTTIQMETTGENNGEQDIEYPNIGFYLSANDIISTDDLFLGEIASALARDAPYETFTNVVIPGDVAAGNYFLGAYIDHDSVITETTVANNVAYYPVSVVSILPIVSTDPATSITNTSANMNATLNPNGLGTTLSFEYGTTTAYGSTATYGNVGSGSSAVTAGMPVEGLTCGTTYHFRARGISSAGTGYGGDSIFATSACPPGC
jgi:hypothetical protein